MNNVTLINNSPQKYTSSKINYANKNSNAYNVVFGNKISIPQKYSIKLFEKCYDKVEFQFRKLLKGLIGALSNKKNGPIYQKVAEMDENSPNYMQLIFNTGKHSANGKTVEVNTESERLIRLTGSNESCIFIMNHNNQRQDPKLLAFFNALLAREYILNGKAESCPRPKIILNDDILTSMNPLQRAAFEKLGAVGIDASLLSADGNKNAKTLFPIMRKFIKDKVHIFIFPEGKMCIFNGLGLEYTFQTGVAELIHGATRAKGRVKVVPLGLAYNKDLGSIHIGEPVYFRRSGKNMLVSRGNMDSPFASQDYVDFFDKTPTVEDGFKVITTCGEPVTGGETPDYISGVLCENIKICTKEAKKAIFQCSHKEKVPVYHVDL